MATLQVAPTRHSQTELISGILTNLYLPSPKIKGEGGRVGKKTAQKWQASNKTKAKTLCKELQASNYVCKPRGAPARGITPPQRSWENC